MRPVAVTVGEGADFDGFRREARRLLAANIAPAEVSWQSEAAPSLFGANEPCDAPPIALPAKAHELIRHAICHRDPERFALLYTLIWRVAHGERSLLEVGSDTLVFQLLRMEKAVRRDAHKMHAFVRFRCVADGSGGERYIAWFEPDHFILDAAAPFFVERFPSLVWSILTPLGSLHWNREALSRGPAAQRAEVPQSDLMEAGWGRYYASTFNPARVNVAQMRKEMPKRYWRNMPETKLIPELLRSAGSRVQDTMKAQPTPSRKREPTGALAALNSKSIETLADLNAVIAAAEPFVRAGTRAVPGEGPLHPALAFVGEQPGDQEDLQGRPFVGPAGEIFTRAMSEAGLRREAAYVTNAVKHFKFEQRGKRRLHQKPTAGEVRHYRWWLEKELEIVAPRLVVALGATAVLALAGKALPVTKFRGPYMFDGIGESGTPGYITVHPSYLLRIPDAAAKQEAYDAFVADLKAARRLAERATRAAS